MTEREGVIKFQLNHSKASPMDSAQLSQLILWRNLARKLNFLGQTPERYQGLGYGNISTRENSTRETSAQEHPMPTTNTSFFISASQTSGIEQATPKHFARVIKAELTQNSLESEGPLPPSSESMTHAAIYQANSQIHWVIHSHTPEIWRHSDQLKLPFTAESIPYGTPEMALAVQHLVNQASSDQGIFVMKGHQDGVVSYASTAEQAMSLLIKYYSQALLS